MDARGRGGWWGGGWPWQSDGGIATASVAASGQVSVRVRTPHTQHHKFTFKFRGILFDCMLAVGPLRFSVLSWAVRSLTSTHHGAVLCDTIYKDTFFHYCKYTMTAIKSSLGSYTNLWYTVMPASLSLGKECPPWPSLGCRPDATRGATQLSLSVGIVSQTAGP